MIPLRVSTRLERFDISIVIDHHPTPEQTKQTKQTSPAQPYLPNAHTSGELDDYMGTAPPMHLCGYG